MKTAIKLSDISFTYDLKNKVLDGLDLSISHGERVGLFGPNGSGKTTLFHIIMGLIKPDQGEIIVYDRLCKDEKDFRFARKNVGLLFQDPNDQLFSPTVAEDIAFGPLNIEMPKDQIANIVKSTLEQVGLSGYEDRITYKLSAGEKHLVALATVLAMKPKMLLLDEPLTSLDENSLKRVRNILRELEIGYLMISHNATILRSETDKIYALENGKFIC